MGTFSSSVALASLMSCLTPALYVWTLSSCIHQLFHHSFFFFFTFLTCSPFLANNFDELFGALSLELASSTGVLSRACLSQYPAFLQRLFSSRFDAGPKNASPERCHSSIQYSA